MSKIFNVVLGFKSLIHLSSDGTAFTEILYSSCAMGAFFL